MTEEKTNIWWFNEESEQMLNRGYLLNGETVEGAIERITDAAAKRLNRPDLKEQFKELIVKGWISFSSPIWANMGTQRGLPISCFNVHIPDSVEGITHKMGEVIMQTKIGGGTSGYFGELRHRGTAVTDNGKSSGSVSFMKLFDTAMDVVSQGGVRRGAFAAYLDIDHGDIEEFLQIRDIGNPIQNLFTGVCVPDYWMQDMIDGDADKRRVWAKVLESRQQKGMPYILFTDNVNRNKPQVYKDKELTINASNLCVAPYTKILTSNGYIPIGDLENERVEVWNGKQFSEVVVRKTGENQKLLRVVTNSGYELDCTPYHKFYIQKGYNKGVGLNKLELLEKRAHELQPGDRLIKFELPLIKGVETLEDAYLNGFYSGDGCFTKYGKRIYLYGEKRNLKHLFHKIKKWTIQEDLNREYGHLESLKDKFFVPDSQYTVESRINWLSGYLDADGTVCNNKGSQTLQVSSINKEFLLDIQLMLQTLGCDSKVMFSKEGGRFLMPKNDGSGELSYYNCKEVYRLLINGNSLYKLSQLGLTCNRLKWDIKKPNRECSQFIQITSVEELEYKQDTYCFTEPLEHKGMFNGILTGNCSEIMLPSTEEESFICCLSSMNLELYDEWKDTNAVKLAIYFLDAVLSEFIEKTEGNYYLSAARNFAIRHRALGLGVLGYHSYLQRNMIPFESMEAKIFNEQVFKQIQEQSLEASKELASIYGEPELLKGYGVRNATLLAIAPTTSSSAILGQTSPGIEPFASNYYKAGLAKGNFIRKNKYLVKLLEEKGLNTEDVWRDIMLNQGSIQHMTKLTQAEKDVFKTFKEISPLEIVTQAAQRQRYIDQAQSLNLNIPSSMPIKDVNKVIIDAWKLGVKTLYYQRSQSVSKELIVNFMTCSSCEA